MSDETEAIRRMWASGDYATIGDTFASVGQELVAEVGVADLLVLDVATGTGNTAIPAAVAGGRVTALDITPELLAVGRHRATERGVDIRWVEADMRSLNFPDGAFDRVLSTFGVFVAPDPVAMAAELVRVCRSGGIVATTAWSPDAAFSRFAETLASHLPADDHQPPPGLAIDPTDWARPDRVRGFFSGLPVSVSTAERTVRVAWASPADAVVMMTTRCGPMMGLRAALTEAGRWPDAEAAVTELLAGLNTAEDGLTVDVPYLRTIIRR